MTILYSLTLNDQLESCSLCCDLRKRDSRGETYAAQFMPHLKVTCVIALLASCIMLTGTHVYMQYYVPQLNYVLIHTE